MSGSIWDAAAAEIVELRARVEELEQTLADTRHSEARYKADRDEAQDKARMGVARSVDALKRAKAAERDAAACADLRSALYALDRRVTTLMGMLLETGMSESDILARAAHRDAATATVAGTAHP